MAVCFQIGDNLQCRLGRQCTPSSAASTGLGPVDKHKSNAVLTAVRVLSIICNLHTLPSGTSNSLPGMRLVPCSLVIEVVVLCALVVVVFPGRTLIVLRSRSECSPPRAVGGSAQLSAGHAVVQGQRTQTPRKIGFAAVKLFHSFCEH